MKIKIDKIFWTEFLIVLLVINYMVITIMLHDNFIFKYARDVILLFLMLFVFTRHNTNRILKNRLLIIFILLFSLMFFVGILKSDSLSVVLVVLRKYYFPLGVLLVVANINFYKNFNRLTQFFLMFFGVISFFGLFQAFILGDSFLRNIGYPVVYSYSYGREMLYNSYYFGGLGIQRVVATLSSSNTCALILGVVLIFLITSDEFVVLKHKKMYYLLILFGYLGTFSRSNFLALIMIFLFVGCKYVPYKKQLLFGCMTVCVFALAVGVYQGSSGFLYKILLWIQSSLNFSESSAAGRSEIWAFALEYALENPLGIGLGHVGSVAFNAGLGEIILSAENSYLTIALDTGIIGLLCYVGMMLTLLNILKINSHKLKNIGDVRGYRICLSSRIVLIYTMIVMFFSNHIQNMEAMSIVYAIVGVAISYTYYKSKK